MYNCDKIELQNMRNFTTNLFLAMLLFFSTTSWAENKTITVKPGEGAYSGTGWCSNWTSNSSNYPVTKIDVAGGINNLNAATTSGGFEFAVGTNGNSNYTWYFSVPGYKIVSYSFKFKSKNNNQNIKVIAGDKEITSSYSEQKTLTVENVNAQFASFRLTGNNYAIVVTDLTFKVRKIELQEGNVYRFVNRNTSRALNACGDNLVNATTESATNLQQQWYVTKDGDCYVLRNLYYAKYLKGAKENKQPWSLTDDYSDEANNFTFVASDTHYTTLETKGWNSYGFMHDDGNSYNGGTRVSSWDNENSTRSSHWIVYEVEYTADELQAIFNEHPTVAESMEKVSENFLALFNDVACCTPRYSSFELAQATLAYEALPDELKQLAKKIYDKIYGSWAEATIAPADRPNGNNNANHNLWTVEENWDDEYAKRFRVQMYEPYSIEGEVTSYLRLNAHCNMDNPTGIYANSGETIYIMVGDDIPEGAELWLAYQSGNGATKYYNESPNVKLHKGLNRVTFTTDGCQMWINYVVHTYNKDGVTIADKFPENRKLSNYKPLKIHIEGGHINGFFNAMGDFRAADSETENLWGDVDNDDDWNYYKARVALPTDFALLGHRQTLLFPFGAYDSEKGCFGVANADGGIEQALAYHLEHIDVVSTPNCYSGNGGSFGNYGNTYYPGMGLSTTNGKINIMLEAWDRIMYSELATMGLVSKSTMDKMNELYPRWTSAGAPAEIYNYGGYQDFCQGVDYSEYFNHHGSGVGAGSGYMSGGWRVCNYHYNTMGSIIGKIAKEAGPTWGPAHEIGHQHQGVFNLNGQTEVTNNFFSNVAVWYMGMGTSRVNGSEGSLESVLAAFNTENNHLYTNNIWAITHLYYRLWLYYHLAGNNTQFWPRLFELCRQVPLENGGQISGTTSLLRFYQHACDAAGEDLTEFFRAHGFFEVMDNVYIGDYSNAIYNVTQKQIDAAIKQVKDKNYPQNLAVLFINDGTNETTKMHDGSTSRSLWDNNPTAEFGSVNDFIAGNVNVTSAYTATLDGNGNVTMSGGEGGVGFLVLNEKGELVSFSNKLTFALGEEARHALISGTATIVSVSSDNSEPIEATIDLAFVKKEILAKLIAEVQTVIDGVDETYTKVGCYKPSAVTDLQVAINVAKDAYANGTAFEGAYEVLYTEYRKVIDNPTSVIGVISGKKYAIKSKSGNDYMTVSGSNVVTTGNSTFPSTDANLWIIETAGENYHIKHAGTRKYLQGVSDKDDVIFTVGDNAVDYKMTTVATAYYALSTAEHSGKYMNRNSSSKVATWSSTDANSQWSITLVDADAADAEGLANLELLASKTRELLNKVADVEYTGDGYPLQADDHSASFYITSNATEDGHEPNFLLDNSTSTFFHTVWASGSPGEAHYLQVDMGADNEIGQFVFSYTTTGQTNVDAPKVIEVKGSNNPNSGFQTIATLSSLPTTHVTPYTSGTLGNDNTKYRYLRFTVTDATGGKLGNYYYFGISEFVIKRMNYQLNGIHSDYPDATNEIVTVAIEKYEAAKLAIANGSGYGVALSDLQNAYEELYNASLTVTNAKKTELEELINATKELINSVGSIVITENVELALQVTNASEAYYLSTNSQEGGDNRHISTLLDGVTNDGNVYFHTDWETSVGTDHHLLLDMGNGNSLGKFTFKYTTRNNNAGIDAPRTIIVEGSDDNFGFTKIAELTDLPTGQHQTYTSAVLGDNAARYRYIRFRVTSGAGTIGGYAYFAMSEFDVTAIGSTTVTINEAYKAKVTEDLFVATNDKVVASELLMNNTTSTELLDAQITELLAAKAALEEAKAMVTVDKDALQSLYDVALDLYNKMADENGNVNVYYEPSALTNEKLSEVKAVMDSAKDKLDNSIVQAEIDDALVALQASYNTLHAVENANVAATLDKSGMNTAIGNAEELIAEIVAKIDYYASVEGLGLADLDLALQNAKAIVSRFYLTEEEYNEKLRELEGCLSATQAVINADCTDRTALEKAIEKAEALLEAIAVKGEGYYSAVAGLGDEELNVALQNAKDIFAAYHTAEQCAPVLEQLNSCYATTNGIVSLDCGVENRDNLAELIGGVNTLLAEIAFKADSTVALPLQATDANAPFYISLSAVGDGNISNIIDKNADGSANIGTYVGSDWGGTIADYTHYVQVDLGDAIAIDELLFGYATRDSGHNDERPTAIKVLGSNDGVDYTEITIIEEGLATGAGERWAMETPLALGGSYRYIRFAVKSGKNSFHMSDFSLYTALSHTLNKYYTTADMVAFDKLCLVLQSAEYVATHYTVSEECEIVYDALHSSYEAVQAVVDADYSNREELQNLIAETEALIARIANVADVETPVWSAANVYCNADNSTNASAGAGDKRGVEALFDGNTGTHLHTTYGGNAQDDDLDHYIRIDMGEGNAVKAFKFNYIGRTSNSGNDPEAIVVQACNTIDGEWVNVRTLTGLPTDGDAVKYTSPLIDMEEAYRYVRLMVTDTQNHSTTTYNGIAHKFFVLSEFGFTAYPTVDIAEEYAYNMYSEPVIDAYIEKNTAIEENEYYMTEDKYNDAVASLQAAKAAIENALLLNEIPVKLTRDVEKPVLYKIKIKSNEKVFEYDGAENGSSKNPVLAEDEFGNRYQAWYFMQGRNEERYDDILIIPYCNEGVLNTSYKLGYPNINSATKPVASTSEASNYNWYITFTSTGDHVTTEGWWNLQPEGGMANNTFVNQQGGTNSTILSFWQNAANPNDNGSQFQFILDETDYSLSDAYFALYNEHAGCGGLKVGGVNVGQYSVTSVEQYNNAYNDAATLLENKTADDSEYNAAREALSSAYSSLERKMPNAGSYYVLRSAYTGGYSENNIVYVGDSNEMYFSGNYSKLSSRAVWQFEAVEGGYSIKSFHTGAYVDAFSNYVHAHIGNEKGVLSLEVLDEINGILKIKSRDKMMHAQQNGSKIVGYNDGLGTASAWYIEELTEEEVRSIYYPYTMSALGYGTLMLGFNAIIPENITASYAAGLDGVSINMVEIEDILPANTPVILKSKETLTEALSLEFVYTTDTASAIKNNMLEGTLWKGVVEAGDARDIYMMQAKNDVVKMYWMYENYDASGQKVLDDNGSSNHDLGGYVMNSANRAYLVINREMAQQAANYSFHFTTEGAMDIEDVECEREIVESIYDLQGRKLEGITQPGFYIVNGKKVYVK